MLTAIEPDWHPEPRLAPRAPKLVWFKREDGSQVIGWKNYDGIAGRFTFWAWTDDARQPTRYQSRWQRAGMTPVKPVAWRPYAPERIRIPSDPIARREAELLVLRVILTDGTMRGLRRGGLESSWDDSLHTDEKERGAGEMIDFEHVNKVRFQPTPKDVQNYEDGFVMSWFLGLRSKGHWLDDKGMSETQHLMVWRAYGYALAFAGDRIRITETNARRLYTQALDHIWEQAQADQRPVRRLKRKDWAGGE